MVWDEYFITPNGDIFVPIKTKYSFKFGANRIVCINNNKIYAFP